MKLINQVERFKFYWENLLNSLEKEQIFSGSFLDRSTAWDIFHIICTFYNSPNRYYHNLTHILDMLDNSQEIISKDIIFDKTILQTAIIFHDVIMVGNSGQSETASASFAYQCLDSLDSIDEFKHEVYNMIMATNYSNPPKFELTTEIKLLIDLDFHILSRPWDIYGEYTRNVRKEYDIIADHIFYYGRISFLNNLLKKDIFQTEEFKNRYQLSTKHNIILELNSIKLKQINMGDVLDLVKAFNLKESMI
jgi:predicted metal-dependent HD superfamily phosphohydrolase